MSLTASSRDSAIRGATPDTGWVFPRKEWVKRDPRDMGINKDALDAIGILMKKARSNGVLIRNGYLVAEWNYHGANDEKVEVQSITKSVTSMLLGVALKNGMIADIHDLVKDYYPGFNVGPYTDEITFWHLVTNTSGIKATHYAENYVDPENRRPGIASQYHNDHIGELSSVLTYIFKEPLINVLRTRVLSVIGGEADWGTDDIVIRLPDGRQIPRNAGYAFSKWTARDLARVGWLYVNKGNWNGHQILSPAYVDASLTPLEVPVMQYIRPPGSPVDTTRITYGYGWRGAYTDSRKLIWYMSGNGGQFCVILPQEGIVFAKINQYNTKSHPYKSIGLGAFESQLPSLVY